MLKRSWAIGIGIIAAISIPGTSHAEEKCFAGASAGSEFCIPSDYYSCIFGAMRGLTCPNGCSREQYNSFYLSEEDKCAKEFGRAEGEWCSDTSHFEPFDQDCAEFSPDLSQCPGSGKPRAPLQFRLPETSH
jgi:hypothetical protein